MCVACSCIYYSFTVNFNLQIDHFLNLHMGRSHTNTTGNNVVPECDKH